VVFEFLEGNIKQMSNGNTGPKRAFIMTMANVRPFLDIDPDYRLKVYRRGERESQDEEEEDEDGETCLNFKR